MSSLSATRLRRSLLLHLFLTPLALIWLFPLWMMVVFSTMPDNGIFSPGIELLPHGNFMDNFNNLQRDTDFVGAIGKKFDLQIRKASHEIDSQCVAVRCRAGCETRRCHTIA